MDIRGGHSVQQFKQWNKQALASISWCSYQSCLGITKIMLYKSMALYWP